MEKLCWKGSMTADMPSHASYLVYIEWRVNLSKLSQKPVWTLRTTTTNPRVSFIDLYWVFPTNLRSYFTPYKHCVFTGTVLWYYHTAWVTCTVECHKNNLHICVCLGITNDKTYFSCPITTSKSLHKDFRTALLVGVPFSLPKNNNRNND